MATLCIVILLLPLMMNAFPTISPRASPPCPSSENKTLIKVNSTSGYCDNAKIGFQKVQSQNPDSSALTQLNHTERIRCGYDEFCYYSIPCPLDEAALYYYVCIINRQRNNCANWILAMEVSSSCMSSSGIDPPATMQTTGQENEELTQTSAGGIPLNDTEDIGMPVTHQELETDIDKSHVTCEECSI